MDSVVLDKKDEVYEQAPGTLKNITIMMCSTDKKTINRIAKEFYSFAGEFDGSIELPLVLPVEEAVYTTRKSPCGNGTATFSRLKLRVHQRQFKLSVYDKDLSMIVEYLKNTPVEVQFMAGQ
ncbi:small subunit ribosomal protein S20e [Pancytospora philotis]|nr:small subunit ribosomal protein S20e [Pancytospora philotis]